MRDTTSGSHTEKQRRVSAAHRLDEDVSHGLRVMPLVHAGGHLLQKELVVLQDLGNLVEHVVYQQGVHDGAAVGLFEGTHVALRGGGDKGPSVLPLIGQMKNSNIKTDFSEKQTPS